MLFLVSCTRLGFESDFGQTQIVPRTLLSALEVPIFVLVFLVGSIVDSSLHMQDPAGAANPAAEEPSRWTSRFWDSSQTQDGGDSISPTEPTISNWIEDVDLPQESPSETLNDLRNTILLESFSKTLKASPETP